MNIINRIWTKLVTVINKIYYRNTLKKFGTNSYIIKPLIIAGHKNIAIHDNIIIAHQAWLAAYTIKGKQQGLLEIRSGTQVGHFSHICATSEIIIEENVLIADKVYISDHLHGYEDVTSPILCQPLIQKNKVRIGKGSWIGENVCIIGSSIGEQSVIGANAVVTKDIPAYCVAVGSPAKIIKRFCLETQQWKKTKADGIFLEG